MYTRSCFCLGSPEDTTSVATELSLKFDESVTEDEIEERSFRSLLPSEAHRRGTLDKKSRHHNESEEDVASPNSTSVSGVHSIFKARVVFGTLCKIYDDSLISSIEL